MKGSYFAFGSPQQQVDITFTFTFSHLADAFIQSDLQLGNCMQVKKNTFIVL